MAFWRELTGAGGNTQNSRAKVKAGESTIRARPGGIMPRKIIDISVPLANKIPADPPGMEVSITYLDHKQSFPHITAFFPGLKIEDMPDAAGYAAIETVTISTHNGTHLDAPYHYH